MSQHELDPDASQHLLDGERLHRFLQYLRANARTRVDHTRVWQSFSSAFPNHPQGLEGRRWLMAVLRALETQGHIRLPVAHGRRWDRSSAIAVPLSIEVARIGSDEPRQSWQSFPWHPNLQWVLNCRYVTPDQVAFLHAVHEGMVEGAFAEPASFKYRSLQLTGNEKRLAVLVKSQLFQPGRLTLADIGCEPDILPLTWEAVSERRNMVIFENAGAYMVGLRVLRSLPNPPYGQIAYGGGFDVLKSVAYVRTVNLELEGIDYVGDMDFKGLEIALSLQKVTERLGLPVLQPATSLHQAMLRSAVTLGASEGWPTAKSSMNATSNDLLTFITPSLRDQVHSVLARGHRIPEEVLGHAEMYEALAAGSRDT